MTYTTATDTATGGASCAAGIECVSKSATLSFGANVATKTNLSGATGATIADAQGIGTITNND